MASKMMMRKALMVSDAKGMMSPAKGGVGISADVIMSKPFPPSGGERPRDSE
jgi:hypothetical protein